MVPSGIDFRGNSPGDRCYHILLRQQEHRCRSGRLRDDIPAKSRELLNSIMELLAADTIEGENIEATFTRKDLRNWTGWPDSTLRKFIKPLEEEQYLTIQEGGTGGKPIIYSNKVEKWTPVSTGLLSYEELSEKLRKGRNE